MDPSPSTSDASATPSARVRNREFAAVAAGGALGASIRWAVGASALGDAPGQGATGIGGMPWDTLFVNVVGCLLVGLAAGRIQRGGLRWSFAVTGFLGGFTTMSTFAVELNDLADAGRTGLLVVYLVATLGGSAVAFVSGETASRRWPGSVTTGPGDLDEVGV